MDPDSPSFRRKLDAWIMRGPPESPDFCEECNQYADPKVGLNDYGNKLICDECYDRHRDEAEGKLEGDR